MIPAGAMAGFTGDATVMGVLRWQGMRGMRNGYLSVAAETGI